MWPGDFGEVCPKSSLLASVCRVLIDGYKKLDLFLLTPI